MFRKRIKKTFLPGTFIPVPARVIAIIQLTLGLMVLLWQLSQPFMSDYFSIKSKITLYQFILNSPEKLSLLTKEQKQSIENGNEFWSKMLNESFLSKTTRSLVNLFNLPLLNQLWLIASILLPILILLKVEGALHAAWLFPMIAFAIATDNQWYGVKPNLSEELALFPKESYLLETYTPEALRLNPFQQRDPLIEAWKKYLVVEWAHEIPSNEPMIFNNQVDHGEYLFTLARVLAIKNEQPIAKPIKEPIELLGLYVLWNIFFAYVVNKYASLPYKSKYPAIPAA